VRRNPVDKSQARNATLKIALTLRIDAAIRVCAVENFNRTAGRKMKLTKQVVVARTLYKIAGTTEKGHSRALLIVSKNPQDAIKVAETEFWIERVTDVSEVSELVWTPTSL
jgi:hypothetical protein